MPRALLIALQPLGGEGDGAGDRVLVDAAHATGAAIESGIGAGAAPQNSVQGAKKRGSHSAAVGKVKLRKPYTAQGGVVA